MLSSGCRSSGRYDTTCDLHVASRSRAGRVDGLFTSDRRASDPPLGTPSELHPKRETRAELQLEVR